MLRKDDTFIITKVHNRDAYSERIQDKMEGSIAKVTNYTEDTNFFVAIFPEYNISQYCKIGDFDYAVIKNKNINIIHDLYKKAMIRGFENTNC